MADAYKCDRCGKFSEEEPEIYIETFNHSRTVESNTSIELCIVCKEKFANFMNKESNYFVNNE